LTKAASASSVAMAAAARPALSHDLFGRSFLSTCLVACLDSCWSFWKILIYRN
jgi:hypothetical protein